jgi:hypothetical protein
MKIITMDSDFAINETKYNLFLSNWRRQHYLADVLVLVFMTLILSTGTYRYGFLQFSIFFIVLCYFSRPLVGVLIHESKKVANIIVRLEFHGGRIKLFTSGFSLYGGLYKREAKSIEVSLDSIKLELSEKDKIIRNKYMGYAFVAELDGVKYYLIGDFFDDFDEILKMFKG